MSETKKSKKALILKILGGVSISAILVFVFIVYNINKYTYADPSPAAIEQIDKKNGVKF